MKEKYLIGAIPAALLIGFLAGREFPRETLLEKECRVFTENVVQRSPSLAKRSGYILGKCLNGTLGQ